MRDAGIDLEANRPDPLEEDFTGAGLVVGAVAVVVGGIGATAVFCAALVYVFGRLMEVAW